MKFVVENNTTKYMKISKVTLLTDFGYDILKNDYMKVVILNPAAVAFLFQSGI